MSFDSRLRKLENLLADRQPDQDAILIHFQDDPPLPKNSDNVEFGPLGPDQIMINFYRNRSEFYGNKRP